MTNRLELNWKVDGFIDEQRYYCSETPININDLPVPKAVLAGDVRNIIDSDIAEKRYYLLLSSVKNSVEKFGEQVSIWASNKDEYWSSVICLLHFNGNANDVKGNAWSVVGASYETGLFGLGARFNGSTNRYYRSPNNSIFKLTGSATIEFAIKLLTKPAAGYYAGILSQRYNYSTQAFTILIDPNSTKLKVELKMSNGNFVYLEEPINLNEFVKIAIEIDRESNKARLFKNGIIVHEVSMPYPLISINYPMQLGGLDQQSGSGGQLDMIIDELRITKDICRYRREYTTLSEPFPDA